MGPYPRGRNSSYSHGQNQSGRVETSDTPDGPDVLDAGDGVEGLGVDGLATGSSSYLLL